jgi:cytochrome P450
VRCLLRPRQRPAGPFVRYPGLERRRAEVTTVEGLEATPDGTVLQQAFLAEQAGQAFGIAEHFCLGAHLTRLEGEVFFEELLAQFPIVGPVGEPKRLRSNFNNALKELPRALRRR